jgi:hypothetical protein
MDRKIETWQDFRNETDSGRHLIGGVRGGRSEGQPSETLDRLLRMETEHRFFFSSPKGGNSTTLGQPVSGAEGAKKHT